jgi:hypothetical protein
MDWYSDRLAHSSRVPCHRPRKGRVYIIVRTGCSRINSTDNMECLPEILQTIFSSFCGGDESGDSGDNGNSGGNASATEDFETAAPRLQARLQQILGVPYVLEPSMSDIQRFAQASGRNIAVSQLAANYFKGAVAKIEELVQGGADAEAVYLFNMMVPRRRLIVIFDKDAGFDNCGNRFWNGDFELVVNPSAVGYRAESIGLEIQASLDIGSSIRTVRYVIGTDEDGQLYSN